MKRFSVLGLLMTAALGLSYAFGFAGSSTATQAQAPCGKCVDCRCPDCNGEFCTCDVCQCGTCGCPRI